jgi:hypothetical protein
MATRTNLSRQVKLFSKRLLANLLSLASIMKYHFMAFYKFGEYLTLDKCLAKNCQKLSLWQALAFAKFAKFAKLVTVSNNSEMT